MKLSASKSQLPGIMFVGCKSLAAVVLDDSNSVLNSPVLLSGVRAWNSSRKRRRW